MAAHLQASMPQLLDLGAGYVLRVTALDATTGNLVAGVKVGAVNIVSAPGAGISGNENFGPYMLVPGPPTDVANA